MELVCPRCTAVNRVPEERLHERPRCGKCGGEILPPQPVDLGEANFAKFLGRDGLPMVVDFWAPWCGPCKMFAPVFAQTAGRYVGRLRFAKVNTEAEQGLAAQHRIQSIPTLAFFRNGQEVDRVAGALSGSQLQEWLSRH